MNEKLTWATQTTEDGTTIKRIDENGQVWWVPEAPGNRHYEEFRQWEAEGNTPEVIES